MHCITVNERCVGWTNNMEVNKYHLNATMNFLSDIFNYRGYIYLNQVYEYLGAAWNPDFENICYRSDGTGLPYEIKHIEDADFMITIHD